MPAVAVAFASIHSAFPGPRSPRNGFFAPAMQERPAQSSQLGASSVVPSPHAQAFPDAFGPASGRRPPQLTTSLLRTTPRRTAPPPPLPIPDAITGQIADPFDDVHAAPSDDAAGKSQARSAPAGVPDAARFSRRPSLDVLARHRPHAQPTTPPRPSRCATYDRTRGQRAVAGILLSRASSAGQKPLRRPPVLGDDGKRAYSPSGLRVMVCVGDL